MNDGGDYGKGFLGIYPPELELKVEHNGSHTTFLDLDISIGKSKFIYKMFNRVYRFNFHIVRMPSITSNLPSINFYSSTLLEFVRIARSTLLLKDFLPVAKKQLDRMISRGGSKHMLLKQIKKASDRLSEAFQKFHTMASDIVSKIAAT